MFMTVIVISEAIKLLYVYFSDMENSDSQDVFTDTLPLPEEERLAVLPPIP
jgi:hypothetical protein